MLSFRNLFVSSLLGGLLLSLLIGHSFARTLPPLSPIANTGRVTPCVPTPFSAVFTKKLTGQSEYENGGVAFGNGLFVAVSNVYSSTSGTDTPLIYSSPDGVNWTARTPDVGGVAGFTRIAFANNQFVAVGYTGEIQTSADGIVWTRRQTPATENHLYGVTYGNGQWVAVGAGNTIFTSPDGITWTDQTGQGTYDDFRQVAYGNGVFVVVGRNQTIVTSPDGITWTEQGGGRGYFGLAFGNNQFVAVGGNGIIATSPDGITWSTQTSGTTDFLSDVAFINNEFVVVNDYSDGKILTSPTGLCWASQSTGITGYGFTGISYANGVYAAIDQYASLYSTAPCTLPVTIAATPSLTVANGSSLTLTASGADSYTWSTPSNLTSISVSPTQTTVYSVTGSSNGCTGTASTTVMVAADCGNPVAAKAISATQTVALSPTNCSVSLKGYGYGTGYTITGPNGYAFSAVYRKVGYYTMNALSVTQPGTYTFTTSYADACGRGSSDTMTYVVTGTACP